jgi:ribosomal protein S18 acetylase RimI-like enzyme
VDVVDLPERLVDEAVRLWHRTGLTRPWNDPLADLDRALTGASSTVLAAVDGGTLAGTVMVGHDGHRGWMYYLAVAPEQQRRGLGARLVHVAEDWLAHRGVPAVRLMVRDGNEQVVGFYSRLGYADAGVRVLGRRLDDGG